MYIGGLILGSIVWVEGLQLYAGISFLSMLAVDPAINPIHPVVSKCAQRSTTTTYLPKLTKF